MARELSPPNLLARTIAVRVMEGWKLGGVESSWPLSTSPSEAGLITLALRLSSHRVTAPSRLPRRSNADKSFSVTPTE